MEENNQQELSRGLKSRHIQMIAIGGAIGTGLFLGSGSAIRLAGPSLILAYIITGFFAYLMMRAIGELLLSNTNMRSFIDFVREYLGEKWEFAIGWAYWLSWASLAMADLTATGIYLRYWFPSLPQWVTPLIVIIALVAMNLVNVRWFGELESGFASIKIFAILALIIIGIIMLLTGFKSGDSTATLANLVNHGGFFATGLHGFILAFPMVIFAFTGIEMVGLTAGETENPEKDLPKAINSVPLRVGLFYVGAMVIIMSIYPWQNINANQSPFVQVFSGMGISFAATIVNFIVLTAALSAANSAIFSTSRTLYVLAKNKQAPSFFGKISRQQVPVNGLVVSSAIFLGAVLLNYFYPSQVFTLITGVATMSFIFVWIILIVTHLRYKKSIGSTTSSNFKMPLYPLSDYVTIAFFVGILIILVLDPATQISVIATVIFFIAMVGGYSLLSWNKRN
ncbi:amino acid permease [Weissella muntiaci]|uniref:Amino acid permease n=1 Tax=Weissella muntiaci TaxID=2508881 RepID=A0A6C2C673_9LACO|nr:amino acid permease [Weissella muntiaci]TYC49103.1 amino acid permease [Weissella muntiaci]